MERIDLLGTAAGEACLAPTTRRRVGTGHALPGGAALHLELNQSL